MESLETHTKNFFSLVEKECRRDMARMLVVDEASEMGHIWEKCRAINKTGVFPQELFTGECGSQRHKCQIYGGLPFYPNVVLSTKVSESEEVL